MKKILASIFCFLLLIFFIFFNRSVVSYEVTPGRLGDNLINYLHAKWFSYEHQVPLIYKPFLYSHLLVLDDKEIHQKDRATRKKLKIKPLFKAKIKKWPIFSKFPLIGFNYKCRYFPESEWECKHLKYSSFPVNWKDENFRKIIKTLIAPKNPLVLTMPPSDTVNIAIHVREGGGFDTDEARMIIPLKLPPLNFYIEGLKYAISLFPEKKLYCHIFTDAIDPKKIVEKIKEAVTPNTLIEFGYRKEKNNHESNVLEDFFSFFHFDILVRSQSNYSLIPSLIHDYAIVYSPKDCRIENNTVSITEVEIEINKGICDKLHSL